MSTRSSETNLRLFVAIRLPASLTSRIADETADLRTVAGVRWGSLEDLHLTLVFLGRTPIDRVGEVDAVLEASARRRPPLELRVVGAGAFPSVDRARVVWVGIEPSPPLLHLQSEVVLGLGRCAIELDRRRYHPHITLGRVARDGPAPELGPAIRAVRVSEPWVAPGMSLMQSELARGRTRHTELASHPFSRGRADSRVGG